VRREFNEITAELVLGSELTVKAIIGTLGNCVFKIPRLL
jgi:hypothetical protein